MTNKPATRTDHQQIGPQEIEAMDHINASLQIEIQQSPPVIALQLADLKFRLNQWFDERRRDGCAE